MSNKFFFDTADSEYIGSVWYKLFREISGEWVYGVTTNPNALSKIGIATLSQFEQTISSLCELVTDIREGASGGMVFVQIPNSRMDAHQIHDWAQYVEELGDGKTRIGLKIPHFTYALDLTWMLRDTISINVTGISDWGTVFKAFQYPIDFASIIPGRMEEKGINANAHLDFIRTDHPHSGARVIAGSMRTVDGLMNAISRGAIPTIGTRVWDRFFETPKLWSQFSEMWNKEHMISPFVADFAYCPEITQTNIQLSIDFFDQMDELGKPLYEEFISR